MRLSFLPSYRCLFLTHTHTHSLSFRIKYVSPLNWFRAETRNKHNALNEHFHDTVWQQRKRKFIQPIGYRCPIAVTHLPTMLCQQRVWSVTENVIVMILYHRKGFVQTSTIFEIFCLSVFRQHSIESRHKRIIDSSDLIKQQSSSSHFIPNICFVQISWATQQKCRLKW